MAKPKTPEYEYTLRDTVPSGEMAWCVIVDNGDPEWCVDELRALIIAQTALDDARKEDYTVTVQILKCVKQNGEAP